MELTENEIRLAEKMQELRPLDIFSCEFRDWQTAVERAPAGNQSEWLEICYAGLINRRAKNE